MRNQLFNNIRLKTTDPTINLPLVTQVTEETVTSNQMKWLKQVENWDNENKKEARDMLRETKS